MTGPAVADRSASRRVLAGVCAVRLGPSPKRIFPRADSGSRCHGGRDGDHMYVGMHVEMSTTYAVAMRSQEDELDAAVDETLTASRALMGLVARSLAEVLEQVTLSQYRVLVVLCAAGPLRSGDLAERLGVHQSTLTRTADRLVAQGLIQRDPSPDSRREIRVSLTDRGQDMVVQVMRQRWNDIRKILGSVSEQDRKVILTGFREFAKLAGEPENEHLLTLGMS